MVTAALSSGLELPTAAIELLTHLQKSPGGENELAALAALYGHLVRLVAPATPSGLRMLEDDARKHPFLHGFGPLPSIRYLMLSAFLFSMIFFGVSLFPQINRATLSHDIYDMNGSPLLVVLTFLLSAAGLGASFGALFDAYSLISQGRYDTRNDSLYWTRIGLGLVSGLMLAELIPQAKGEVVLERPLLALLGGFSASVVHQILQRMVDALQSFFVPVATVDPADKERLAHDRVVEAQGVLRSSLARSMDGLLDDLAAGGSIGEARQSLVKLLSAPMGAFIAPAAKPAKMA